MASTMPAKRRGQLANCASEDHTNTHLLCTVLCIGPNAQVGNVAFARLVMRTCARSTRERELYWRGPRECAAHAMLFSLESKRLHLFRDCSQACTDGQAHVKQKLANAYQTTRRRWRRRVGPFWEVFWYVLACAHSEAERESLPQEFGQPSLERTSHILLLIVVVHL